MCAQWIKKIATTKTAQQQMNKSTRKLMVMLKIQNKYRTSLDVLQHNFPIRFTITRTVSFYIWIILLGYNNNTERIKITKSQKKKMNRIERNYIYPNFWHHFNQSLMLIIMFPFWRQSIRMENKKIPISTGMFQIQQNWSSCVRIKLANMHTYSVTICIHTHKSLTFLLLP